ncbi:diaminopimelate epimerase [Helicobacter ailurogastricus]|uniref:diaminopimelate epimerase n=1 Tax=Helicobacter ailurogastricus TaxID=1578720 RepID=UPI00244D940F|nr:diaminopimelate epimerase [Helicobacter ailurogastricus]GMB91785.1 Diaminopimelate epimerase DapF [Helicobacter ailurogastricus]
MHLYKYCASGNDFLITHHFKPSNRQTLAKELCNRHFGFGADGLVVLLPHDQHAYTWEFYNADGSLADMCGNASRCVGLYAYEQTLAPKKHSFLSGAGVISVEVLEVTQSGGVVQSNLGAPKWLDTLDIQGQEWALIDTGVPHLVHFVASLEDIPKAKTPTMQALRQQFNANVNVAYIKDPQTIHLATYERGVEDITLACGTGMAAVFVAGLKRGVEAKARCIPPSKEVLTLGLEKDEVLFSGAVKKVGRCLTNTPPFAMI